MLMVFVTILYLYNFHINDIWTPNESFYAEAVREMFESGNFLDIQYNYEPRYNKPPLTYWAIAASSAVFGLNEFGIRLPIVLMALGSIWVTYLLGKHLYGQKAGFYSLLVMAFSLQLLAVKQYASPEIPLTFFFTLTLYWFIKAFDLKSFKYLMLAYTALGLTVLTKGFPYIFVIGAIIGLYTLLKHGKNLKGLWRDIVFLRLPLGLIITGGIGMSWVIFMYLKDGQDFWQVYYTETFGRALSKSTKGTRPFFYLGVLSWSVLPYTLAFIYAIVYWIKNRTKENRNLWLWCWLAIMLVIFTISKGKLPTYMIQAHSAIAVIVASMLIQKNTKKLWLNASLLFPAMLVIVGSIYFILEFNMHWAYYALPLITIGLIGLSLLNDQVSHGAKIIPFWAMAIVLFLLNSFLPKMEAYRPYDTIGEIVLDQGFDQQTPLLMDAWQIHNLPYYTERKTLRDQSTELINQWNKENGETLAFLPTAHLSEINFEYKVLWSGMIYNYPTESQFFKYLMACNEALNGDTKKFRAFSLIRNP